MGLARGKISTRNYLRSLSFFRIENRTINFFVYCCFEISKNYFILSYLLKFLLEIHMENFRRSFNELFFFSPYREKLIFYTCYYYYFKRKMAHGKISTRNIYKVCLFSRIVRLIFSYTVCSRFPKIVLLSSNIYWKSAWKIFKLNVLLSFVS